VQEKTWEEDSLETLGRDPGRRVAQNRTGEVLAAMEGVLPTHMLVEVKEMLREGMDLAEQQPETREEARSVLGALEELVEVVEEHSSEAQKAFWALLERQVAQQAGTRATSS
jgi:hypothetical protein